jgi:hypothetical protein
VTRVLTNVMDVATTGLVASARPAQLAISDDHGTVMCMAAAESVTTATFRPRTTTAAAPVQGSGLPAFTGVVAFGLEARTYRTQTKAVTTQDPQHPVSGQQLEGHPPV